ncbi:MAG: Gfo/Idh/MocA family oxidoreductase, partial [Planctomycetota bacterium]
MQRIRFGIVGAGWRSEFFQRAAAAAPERFEMAGAVVRDPAKGAAFEKKWDRPSFRTIDAMLSAGTPRFVVVCVKWAPTPEVIAALGERGVPVLSETPPAPDIPGLVALNERADREGWKVQVAEQYPFQPHHAARISAAQSGILGTVTQAQVSCAHGYHGVSLIRRFLGVRFEEADIVAREFTSPLLAAAERADVVKAARWDAPKQLPAIDAMMESKQTLAWLDFGGRLGVFDFAKG